MSDKVKVFEQFGDMWVTGDVDALDDLFAPDVAYHLPPFPDMDRSTLKQFMVGFHAGFPDFTLTIEEDLIDGERSVHRWTCTGTFSEQSPVLPVAPTGRATRATGSHVVHWTDGRPSEVWHFGDWLGWLQGAGVVPALG